MKKILVLVVLIVIGANAVVWTQVWGPESRAHEVADVLSGRAWDASKLDDSWPDYARKLSLQVREKLGLADAAHDAAWTTRELMSLAHGHPAALAHAATRERDPEVRFALFDVIEDKPAYASEVPLAMKVEHIASHVVMRLDRPTGKPLNDGEKSVLAGAHDDALPSLRKLLVHGHCGALAGYDALGERPKPDEILAAASAIARAAADPASDLTTVVQDSCRDRLAAIAAPTTDGDFRVHAAGR